MGLPWEENQTLNLVLHQSICPLAFQSLCLLQTCFCSALEHYFQNYLSTLFTLQLYKDLYKWHRIKSWKNFSQPNQMILEIPRLTNPLVLLTWGACVYICVCVYKYLKPVSCLLLDSFSADPKYLSNNFSSSSFIRIWLKYNFNDASDGLYHSRHARCLRVHYTDEKCLLLLELQTRNAARAVWNLANCLRRTEKD